MFSKTSHQRILTYNFIHKTFHERILTIYNTYLYFIDDFKNNIILIYFHE